MKKMLRVFVVMIGLIFVCISCQQAGNNAEKTKNPAEEYADKLLKAKKDAKDAAGATEQSQKDVNQAAGEGERKDK